MTLPAGACSYWQRAAGRDADDDGFGASPWGMMTPEQCDAHELARDQEDEKDPPCGTCSVCVDAEARDPREPPFGGL